MLPEPVAIPLQGFVPETIALLPFSLFVCGVVVMRRDHLLEEKKKNKPPSHTHTLLFLPLSLLLPQEKIIEDFLSRLF